SAAPAAAPADSAAVTGGLSVQVTSQKSEAAAMSAFRSMQSRYAQVLGRYQPNVQRADLGDRGTYYRVRVGPFAGDGASRVCSALKAAGGDCIIVK
ncbi:MAG: SPOR domain-containing protein, partial [Rhizobiales bacterium]|nr:SPOR domain-containing protein [Hyphomicrobiales bacterium]